MYFLKCTFPIPSLEERTETHILPPRMGKIYPTPAYVSNVLQLSKISQTVVNNPYLYLFLKIFTSENLHIPIPRS